MANDRERMLKWISRMKKIRISEDKIGDLLEVDKSSVNRWLTKDSKINDFNVDKFIKSEEALNDKVYLFEEVIKKEKKRLKEKEGFYEGHYVTLDKRDCFKDVKEKMFDDSKEFEKEIRNLTKKLSQKEIRHTGKKIITPTGEIIKPGDIVVPAGKLAGRKDTFFYHNITGYYLDGDEVKEFGMNTEINDDINSSLEDMFKHLAKSKRKYKVKNIVFTEFSIHGSHEIEV